MSSFHYWSRRQFLRYAAGSIAALPFLDLSPHTAYTQPASAGGATRTSSITKPSIRITIQPVIEPTSGSALDPTNMYNLLIVGQGYNNAEVDKFWADYNTVYTYLQNTDPFSSALKRWSFSYNEYGIYADPGIGVSWGISSSPLMPDVLTLPSDIEKRISAYLESRGIQTTNDLDNLIPATSLWNANRFGDTGCLIVILVKSQQKGEFYDLIPRVDRPYPIVAVTTVGQLWVQLVGRALAQSRALLGDEFEMEGPAFDKPPSDYLYLPGSIPNLLMIDDAMRAKMRANCTDVYDLLPPDWRPFPVLAPFFPNENRKANEEPRDCNGNRADTGWFKAVEGGFGYRHNVIRADVDCLMRRIPASYKLYNPAPPNADLLPVQADVDFCSACKGVLHNRLHRDTFGLDELRPRTLETQRSQIAVSWRERHEIQPFPSLPFSVTKEDPSPHLLKWQYTSEVNAIDGLVIRDVKLLNRNDFFKKAENVLKSVRFTDLGVRFTDGSAQSLKFADGISNTQFPPQLVFYSHGGEGDMLRVGVKLMASWVVSGYRVEATASLVLRDQARDIEPGAFLDACRLYPQLTMKYEAIASTNLRVKELYGTIEIVANNVIPESLRGTLGEYIGEIQYGQLAVEFVTDSNTSDDDAVS